MKNYLNRLVFALGLILLGFFAYQATAAVPMLTLTPVGGNAVQVTVQGDPNSQISLAYYGPYSSATPSWIGAIGSTDSSGSFSATLSQNIYGIPAGSSVFVRVNGYQSPAYLWPIGGAYNINPYQYNQYNQYNPYGSQYPYQQYQPWSPLTLSTQSLTLGVSESRAVSVTAQTVQTFHVQSNSNNTVAQVTISGSQVTVTGLAVGSSQVTLCVVGTSNCAVLSVTVQQNSLYANPYQYPYGQNYYPYQYNQYNQYNPYGSQYPYQQQYGAYPYMYNTMSYTYQYPYGMYGYNSSYPYTNPYTYNQSWYGSCSYGYSWMSGYGC